MTLSTLLNLNLGDLPPVFSAYSEMYYDGFKYPSEWTQDWDSYLIHREELCHHIIVTMTHYEKRVPEVRKQAIDLTERFFSCQNLLSKLI